MISGTVEDTSTTKTAVYLLKDGTTEFNKTEGLLLGTDNRFSWTVYEVHDGKYKIKVIYLFCSNKYSFFTEHFYSFVNFINSS